VRAPDVVRAARPDAGRRPEPLRIGDKVFGCDAQHSVDADRWYVASVDELPKLRLGDAHEPRSFWHSQEKLLQSGSSRCWAPAGLHGHQRA
jgi:hypothetical protein